MIRLENVSKVYRTSNGLVHALREVTLSVERGEFVAVQGPSGCGKSTLLLIAGGLSMPTSGRVIVVGQELPAVSPAERARFRAERVGFVFQMFHLLPYLNVVQNVVAAALPDQHAAARDRAAELLERFQLGHRLTHRPAELSAGERQRVAIARALINQPDLLLADEPTGNLDPQSATGVLDLLGEFHRGGGTVLLVTHQQQAAGYAQRTIRLQDGSVLPLQDASAVPPG